MASRIKQLTIKPWNGGIHTALEPTLIEPNELVEANETRFTTSSSRRTRGGLPYWDYIGIGIQKSSSGTTRTVRATINSGITVTTSSDICIYHKTNPDSDYDILKVNVDTITNVSGDIYDITYTGSNSVSDAITADVDMRVALFSTSKIIGIRDYWYFFGSSKIQKRVAVRSDGTFWQYSSTGSQTQISTTSLSLSTPITKCDFEALGEKLIISFSGVGNKPVIWDGSSNIIHVSNIDFDGNDVQSVNPTPDIEFMQVHQNRIWATDKADPDKIHYCDINEPTRWSGEGDSGALIAASGDGDTTGFSAILPPYKGILPIAKSKKLYHLVGEAPYIEVREVSKGIGAVSHKAGIAVDHDDVAWASNRGFHSMAATSNYGDLESAFLSKKIQPTFNALESGDLDYIQGVYDGNINSLLWIVRESGQSSANKVILYNIITQAWYKWGPSSSEFLTECIAIIDNSRKNQILLGTYNGRIIEYNEEIEVDLVNTPVSMNVKTGIIYPDGDPYHIKGFKTLGIFYKTERQSVSFTVKVKVDNYEAQQFTISQSPSTDTLGNTFVLGSSTLGFKEVLLPEYLSIDGYGYGIELEITASTQVDIYGYTIGYEAAGDQLEVIRE